MGEGKPGDRLCPGSPAARYAVTDRGPQRPASHPVSHPPAETSALVGITAHPFSLLGSATILAAHRRVGSVGVAILALEIASWKGVALRVALFVPCYVDQINPEVGVSVVRVLRRLGVEVTYPEGQTCCGQPAFNSGFFDEARAVGRRFLDVFERERFDYIVCPSGSCTTMVSHYYPFIFENQTLPDERERSEALGERVREFSDFLVNVLGVKEIGRQPRGEGGLPHRLPPAAGARDAERAARAACTTSRAWSSWSGRTRSCVAGSGGPSR